MFRPGREQIGGKQYLEPEVQFLRCAHGLSHQGAGGLDRGYGGVRGDGDLSGGLLSGDSEVAGGVQAESI